MARLSEELQPQFKIGGRTIYETRIVVASESESMLRVTDSQHALLLSKKMLRSHGRNEMVRSN